MLSSLVDGAFVVCVRAWLCGEVHRALSSLTIISLKESVGPEVIKLEYSLKLKIKCNDWQLADTCPQASNHCALF